MQEKCISDRLAWMDKVVGDPVVHGNLVGFANTNRKDLRAFPNPFVRQTSISFRLSKIAEVNVKVYTSQGKEVATLLSAIIGVGLHQISWNGMHQSNRQWGSGIYLCVLRQVHSISTLKIILLNK